MSPFWRTVARFDRHKIAPWMGLRNALGVALVLAIGVAAGDPSAGTVAALGALNVSYSDGPDPYLHRARRMLAASLLCALAVMAGAISAHHHGLALGLAAAWAFTAGLMVAVSPTAGDIGLMTLVSLVVFAARPIALGEAAVSGLLALGGGLVETALALALWPVRRHAPERGALAVLYAELARMAAGPEGPTPATEAPPASGSFSAAHAALDALAFERSLESERYLALLSQAERMRLALLALSREWVRLGREPDTETERGTLRQCLELAARISASIGQALETATPEIPNLRLLDQLMAHTELLRTGHARNPSAEVAAMVRDACWQLEALAGQLRSAGELAAGLTPSGSAAFWRREAAQPWKLRLAGASERLRANLHWESAAFRHAVRLAACVALGDVLGHILDWRRSYWITMTIAIVLKPDFTSTFSRGLLRLAGTLAGLGVATALFHALAPTPGMDVALIGGLTLLLRGLGPANYGVFAVVVTALVVVLIAITGIAPGPVIAARGWNTMAGGVIALLAYWLWPTWERGRVAEALANLLDAYRAYFQAVRDAYLHPGEDLAGRLDRVRLAARLARSNLEASLDRLSAEPRAAPARLSALRMLSANLHRFIHAAMALEAGLAGRRAVPARAEFRAFAEHVDLTIYLLAARLRGSPVSPGDLPDLRADHRALLAAGPGRRTPAADRYALVNLETDRITNSLNTIVVEVFQWMAAEE